MARCKLPCALPFIVVEETHGGYKATMYHYNTTEDSLKPGEGFWEPWVSLPRSKASRAVLDAKRWAKAEGIPFFDKNPWTEASHLKNKSVCKTCAGGGFALDGQGSETSCPDCVG